MSQTSVVNRKGRVFKGHHFIKQSDDDISDFDEVKKMKMRTDIQEAFKNNANIDATILVTQITTLSNGDTKFGLSTNSLDCDRKYLIESIDNIGRSLKLIVGTVNVKINPKYPTLTNDEPSYVVLRKPMTQYRSLTWKSILLRGSIIISLSIIVFVCISVLYILGQT